MARAGDYSDRVEWLQRTKGTPDAFGGREATFTYPSQGFLWSAIEDVSANRETRKEGENQLSSATVRIRNYPAVAPGDRLSGVLATMTVKTVVQGDNEITCDVEW